MAGGGARSGGKVWLKRLAIGAVVLGGLIAGGAVLAVRLIDWNKARLMAQGKGSPALGRPVTIEALSVPLLSGVEVKGFRIGPAPRTNQPALVEAGKVVARYRLLPLLGLSAVIARGALG